MKIKTRHPNYPKHAVRRATRWAAKQIGLDGKVLRTLTIEVGYRRSSQRTDGDTWGGRYRHDKLLVQVLLGRNVRYPTPAGHNRSEADRFANDEWELFVSLLAHELEHARCFAVAKSWEERARLNHEPRVRAVDWRVLLAFREARETLLTEWTQPVAERPEKPKPSVVDRRAMRAAKLLADWQRRLKTAKTKVAKYRRRVAYYSRTAKQKA